MVLKIKHFLLCFSYMNFIYYICHIYVLWCTVLCYFLSIFGSFSEKNDSVLYLKSKSEYLYLSDKCNGVDVTLCGSNWTTWVQVANAHSSIHTENMMSKNWIFSIWTFFQSSKRIQTIRQILKTACSVCSLCFSICFVFSFRGSQMLTAV